MYKTIIRSIVLAGALAVFTGCESGPAVKEVSEEKSLTSDRLDIQNFNRAVTELTNKMLTTPRVQEELARISRESGGRRPLVKISRIKNDTGLKINMTDYLITPMEEVFVNSGKLDFFSDDKNAQELGAANDMLTGNQARLPNLVLNGVVNRNQTSDGSTTQQTYIFRLQLVDPAGGNTFFVGNTAPIIKQSNRAGMSF